MELYRSDVSTEKRAPRRILEIPGFKTRQVIRKTYKNYVFDLAGPASRGRDY